MLITLLKFFFTPSKFRSHHISEGTVVVWAFGYQSPTRLLTRGCVGVCSERDKLLWGKEQEEAWPEAEDPEQGFFVKADAEPYSALYVHLVV